MEYRVVGPSYALRNVRCLLCNKPIRQSVVISDLLVPNQEGLGVTIEEHIAKAHNVCIDQKGIKRV